MKFEYIVRRIPGKSTGVRTYLQEHGIPISQSPQDEALMEDLNKYGQDGWEVVTLELGLGGAYVVFKREMPDGQRP